LILVRPEKAGTDLEGLLRGEESIARWLKEKIQDYRERGVLPEKQE
jgi:hypothetical protein